MVIDPRTAERAVKTNIHTYPHVLYNPHVISHLVITITNKREYACARWHKLDLHQTKTCSKNHTSNVTTVSMYPWYKRDGICLSQPIRNRHLDPFH